MAKHFFQSDSAWTLRSCNPSRSICLPTLPVHSVSFVTCFVRGAHPPWFRSPSASTRLLRAASGSACTLAAFGLFSACCVHKNTKANAGRTSDFYVVTTTVSRTPSIEGTQQLFVVMMTSRTLFIDQHLSCLPMMGDGNRQEVLKDTFLAYFKSDTPLCLDPKCFDE